MAQWGVARWFSQGEIKIRVLAHVETPTWHPIEQHNTVDELLLMGVQGCRQDADRMLGQLKAAYVGKPHSLWATQMIAERQNRSD
jgi:hypothetical protein